MHDYSLDSCERQRTCFGLAVLSICTAWLMKSVYVHIPWWFDAPSVLGLYGIYCKLFDKYGWKWEFLNKSRLINTPNINGTWGGFLQSSYDNHEEKYPAIIEIKQEWTKIIIIFKAGESSSKSITASFLTKNSDGALLYYQYTNEPKSSAAETMQIHRGTAWFRFSNDFISFEGEYYTGRGRSNFGSLTFKKK